jgi:hypothetical protein
MTQISLGRAWDESAAFVKRHAGLLFPIAFVLVAIPAAILAATTPGAEQGQLPPAGPWIALLAASIVLGLAGQIALTFLAVRGDSTVGQAIGRGFRRFLPLFGAMLLVFLALLILAFFVILVIALLTPGAASTPPDRDATLKVFRITLLLFAPLLVYLGARILPLTPTAAAEEGGPLTLLRRSFALTRGNVWRLVGFILLVAVLVVVVNLAVASVGAIVATLVGGEIRPGSISSFIVLLIGAALQTVITVYLATIIARIYVQLAGEPSSGI